MKKTVSLVLGTGYIWFTHTAGRRWYEGANGVSLVTTPNGKETIRLNMGEGPNKIGAWKKVRLVAEYTKTEKKPRGSK